MSVRNFIIFIKLSIPISKEKTVDLPEPVLLTIVQWLPWDRRRTYNPFEYYISLVVKNRDDLHLGFSARDASLFFPFGRQIQTDYL